jgi:CheY-like chemotaxis protein
MENHYDYKKYSVLYVDDEPQALKYFAKAFTRDFRIRTAASAAEALQIIEQDGDDVGVLITDQRMPVQTGTNLMEQVRARRPEMVRILTTAYSDLTSAIEAVNAGGAFRYVTKPWKIPELQGVLLRAMEHFLVRKDRDRLMAEKLHVLQRVVVMDRIRGLAALATALECRLRHTTAALKSYVKQAPMEKGKPFTADAFPEFDLWALARSEGEGLVHAVREVLRNAAPTDGKLDTGVKVDNVVREYVGEVQGEKAEEGVAFEVQVDGGVPGIKADLPMIRRLIEILSERISDMDGEDRVITIRVAAAGEEEVCVRVSGDNPGWYNGQVASLYSAVISKPVWPMGMDMDVLAAFFITHHHGGDVTIQPSPPLGPGFEVILARDPEADETLEESALDAAWFDSVFSRIEAFDETVLV